MRRFFGRGKKPKAGPDLTPHGPLEIALGGAVQIDTLGLQASLASGEPAMGPPVAGTLIVSAIGTASLGPAAMLTRYYDDHHRMLQVMAPPGASSAEAVDFTFYAPWDSVSPAGPAEWSKWTGQGGLIGAPTYDADGILFSRFWGEGDEHAPLTEFTETIRDEDGTREIHQQCMLYARPVGAGQEMLLLNVERELSDGRLKEGSSIEFMIGYGLGAADVTRV